MNKKNVNFAAAIAYLKERGDIKAQKELAQRMGVSEDTISRILQGARVSESSITKLHAATNGLFNLQWLHGQSNVMLSAEVIATQHADPTTAALLAAKDETIAALRSQLSDKDKLIGVLQQQIDSLRMQLTVEKGLQSTGVSRLASAERSSAAPFDGK